MVLATVKSSRSLAFASIGSVSFVVPCYNEEAALESLRDRLIPVLRRCREHWDVQLVLVDDGSTDNTSRLLRDYFESIEGVETRIVRHESNCGLGAAMTTAAASATGDVICTLDSDCTYDPEEAVGLIGRLLERGADVVTGSPYHPDGSVEGIQAWRLMLSKGASIIYGTLLPGRLHCYTSMFRAYRRESFRPDLVSSQNFVSTAELLVGPILAGARVIEYPAVLHRRQHGESKMRVLTAGLSHLGLMARVALRHGFSKPEQAPSSALSLKEQTPNDSSG